MILAIPASTKSPLPHESPLAPYKNPGSAPCKCRVNDTFFDALSHFLKDAFLSLTELNKVLHEIIITSVSKKSCICQIKMIFCSYD